MFTGLVSCALLPGGFVIVCDMNGADGWGDSVGETRLLLMDGSEEEVFANSSRLMLFQFGGTPAAGKSRRGRGRRGGRR